jgi:RNA 2',3'-cyclic 3'-phosphodiesterase
MILRLFVAIALPEEIRRRIADFQHEWQAGLGGNFIRWTPAEQIHLTLRFLGGVPAAAVPELEAALRRACKDVSGFELAANGSGCFPEVRTGGGRDGQIGGRRGEGARADCVLTNAATGSARKPRVLWVGVSGDTDALGRLQRRIADETRTWGEIEAREFRAHLTLGRVKDGSEPAARGIAQRAQTLTCGELGRWRAGEVLLMRSELSPAGARHAKLAGIRLG